MKTPGRLYLVLSKKTAGDALPEHDLFFTKKEAEAEKRIRNSEGWAEDNPKDWTVAVYKWIS